MSIEVSVIVPTFNRRFLLAELVPTLLAQTLSPARYEILIVSDGSTDGTVQWLQSLQAQNPHLICLEQANRGPAAARNMGARHARGRYLVFTDDDCLATPEWLERMLEAFHRTGAVAVQGRTSTDAATKTPFTRQVARESMDCSMPTCNVGYTRAAFEAVGGFDESFPFPHNEDTDLAWRVAAKGQIVFASDARVIHPPREETLFQRASWVRYLESEFLLHAKHRERYRQVCGGSPWSIIYRKIFLVAQLYNIRRAIRYLVSPWKPRLFGRGLALVFVRWFNLVRFFPHYLQASRRYPAPVLAPVEPQPVTNRSL
jgi:GT2 family glycosyltransferase